MPNYPFTPELLEALPEELAQLFQELELWMLEEICARLKAAGDLNQVSIELIRALRGHGISFEEVQRAIQETAGIAQEKLDAIFEETIAWNQSYYEAVMDAAQLTSPPSFVSDRDVLAIRRQTREEFRNLTQSMGFQVKRAGRPVLLPPREAYQWALDMAELKVMSGAVSYSQAISGAVKELADSGLRVVNYQSGGTNQLDVAVRRAVLTGINQINQKYREQSMDYLQTDLVEVTAHRGARDKDGPHGWENHKKWQGKVYRWRR